MHRFACAALVDARGWLLLQERDEHPLIAPEKWSFPGGHVEEGEDFEAAVHRELAEETGVHLARGELALFGEFELFHKTYGSLDTIQVFVAATRLSDTDIECHEGRQIVFVDPSTLPDLALSELAELVLPQLLASAFYRYARTGSGS